MDIYLDNAATTAIIPEVREAVIQAMDSYGNPSSLHQKGVDAERLVTNARDALLRCVGRPRGRIIFTGGGTEANNLAIVGVTKRYRKRGNHLVTTSVEHPSVLETFRYLEQTGWRVTYVAPESDGRVDASAILEAVTAETVLVSVMHVNNETGAVQDVGAIGECLRSHPKTLFHVDGIQAFGKLPDCLGEKAIDLYSVSGHKLGAPKGIGAVILREGLVIDPLIYGGGQEFGLRSGTENSLGIAGLATAAQVAHLAIEESYQHVSELRQRLLDHMSSIPGVTVHNPKHVSPYILSVSFPGIKGEVLVHALESEGVFVSTGSACSSKGGRAKASHVLQAMGCAADEVTGTLRLSLSRLTTAVEVDAASETIQRQVEWLAAMGGKVE